ncbi:uncharacterized protein LOC108991215 [Juglans regia]|uniref:Uncharacterized protein LOC108991215 n=1 Tax=Juglans regia TaxID=51240 RepID=A0A2I4ENH2_JUGRE|nr:uncharacterized protein LOC108991215 [Juglans regia]
MWSMNVPAATKLFVWRAVSDLLPTRKNLWKKKIVEDPLCPICNLNEETISHVMWSCPATVDVWGDTRSPISKWPSGDCNFEQKWLDLCRVMDQESMEKVAVIMRGIWYRRNKYVFENKFWRPGNVVQMAVTGLEDYYSVNEKKTGLNKGKGEDRGKSHWRCPVDVDFKVNFDGAFDQSSSKIGMGVVIRDKKGEVVAALSASRREGQNAFVAEGMALWRAMEFCLEIGMVDVEFDGDSKELIEAVMSDEEEDSRWGQIVEDIKQLRHQYSNWKVVFNYRESNEVAHNLAKMALLFDEELVWIEEVPSSIHQYIVKDNLCNDLQ